MSRIEKIQNSLKKGLFVDNLTNMTKECMELAKKSNEPATFYILASVFNDIAQDWSDRPVLTVEKESMEKLIGNQLGMLVEALVSGKPSSEIGCHLNSMLREFLRADVSV